MTSRFLLAALTAAPLAAVAQPAPAPVPAQPQMRALFDRMDVNDDGFVDDVELMRRLIFVFGRMDQNRDKLVSRAEYEDWPRLAAANGQPVAQPLPEKRVRRFARLDRNGDGALSFEEYKTVSMYLLDRADRNRDARLDRSEVAAAD